MAGRSIALGFVAGWLGLAQSTGAFGADRVTLRDGFTLVGTVDQEESTVMVLVGPQIYRFATAQLLKPEPAKDVPARIGFPVKQPLDPKAKSATPQLTRATFDDFDKFGRRKAVVYDMKDRQSRVVQGITSIYPTYVVVQALDAPWKSSASLTLVNGDVLRGLLHKAIDEKNPADQIKIVEFLIQAKRFEDAEAELKRLGERFPMEDRLKPLTEKLAAASGAVQIDALERRLRLGLLKEVAAWESELRKAMLPADLAGRLDALKEEADKLRSDTARITQALDNARPALAALGEDGKAVAAALDEIRRSVSPATLPRLAPALALVDQPGGKPEPLMALAVSGWCLGPTLARDELPAAADLWRQRELLRESLTADGVRLEDILHALGKSRLPGTPAQRAALLAAMLPLLPAPVADFGPDRLQTVQVKHDKFGTMEFVAYLPPGYDRYRSYPAVLALHDAGKKPELRADIWQPIAAEYGMIVIAPKWRIDETAGYRFSIEENVLTQEILSQARRMFAIDSDRVTLCGHGLGATAAWDMGLAHPDQYNALIVVTGVPQGYCRKHAPNVALLPTYAIQGGLAGGNPQAIRAEFAKMHASGFDAIYAEYPYRAPEEFRSELEIATDWLLRKIRPVAPRKFTVASARACDKRFYWTSIEGFRSNAVIAPELLEKDKAIRPATIDATATEGNTLLVNTTGVTELAIHLPPGLVQFDAPNLQIKVNSRVVHKGPVTPDVETLVREVRRTGDRKNLTLFRLKVSKP